MIHDQIQNSTFLFFPTTTTNAIFIAGFPECPPSAWKADYVGTDPDIAADDQQNNKQANVHNTWPASKPGMGWPVGC